MQPKRTCAIFLSILVFALGSVAMAQELVTPEIITNPEVKLLDEEGAGKLYQVGEHLVCVMEGTHAEMGYQHGRLLADRIRGVIKEGYMVKALYDKGYTREYIDAQSVRMEKHFPKEYIEEIRGLVAGLKAGGVDEVSYEEALSAVTQSEIAHHDPDTPPGCSNFAAWGKWTSGGRLLHGRNLDWDVRSGAQDNAAILVWRPKGGTPFMMVGWTGCIGSVSGMNAKGITIGEMTSSSTEETFDGLPLMLIMRRVLEKGNTLDEAVAIMKQGPRTTGWNFIIGYAGIPDGRALEVDAVDCEAFAPMDPKENEKTGHWAMEDAVRRTNHPCGLVHIDKLVAKYGPMFNVEPDDLEAAIPLLKMQNTWQRYDWLGKRIQACEGKMDVPEALQLLANGPVKSRATLHSFVFDPKNQAAYVAIAGNNPPVTATDRAFTKIDLKQWFE